MCIIKNIAFCKDRNILHKIAIKNYQIISNDHKNEIELFQKSFTMSMDTENDSPK